MAGTEVTFDFLAAGTASVEQAFDKIDKRAERSATRQTTAAAKAEKATTRSATQAASAQTNQAERADRQRARSADRTSSQIIQSSNRETKARVANAQKVAEAERRSARDTFSTLSKGFAGAAITAAGLAIGTVGAAVRQEFAIRGAANRISIAGARPGQDRVAPAEIASALHGAAAATPGVDAQKPAKGMHEMVKLGGDTAGAIDHLKTMATTMQALGIGGEDTAKIMTALKQSFGIESVKDMQASIATLEAQARAAGIPMEDLGSHILTMAASGKRFGMTGAKGAADMGGLLAIARTGIGDPEKAEKGAGHFLEKLTEEAPKLAAMGIKVYNAQGKINPIGDVIKDLISKTGGSNMALKKVELTKLLGAGERGGAGVIGSALGTYTSAYQGARGTEAQRTAAAMAALDGELKNVMSTAATWNDVEKDAAQAQAGTGAQLSAAWEKLSADIGGEVAPVLAKFASHAGEAVEILEKLAEAGGLPEAFEVLKVDIEALGDAIKVVHELLGIKAKPASPLTAYTHAQKDLARFEKQHKGMWNEEGEAEERARLTAKVKDAESALYVKPRHLMALGDDRFADMYADASGLEKGSFRYNLQRDVGRRMAASIHDDPMRDQGLDAGVKQGLINPAQRQLSSDLQDETNAAKARAAFEALERVRKGGGDAATAMNDLARTIAVARGSLEQLGGAADRSKPISDR